MRATRVPGGRVRVLRVEGGPNSSIPDVNDAYTYAGDTYNFYASRFGRDSLDGHGLTLTSTTRYCDSGSSCPFVNAFWDGSQMVYGRGSPSTMLWGMNSPTA